MTDDPTGKDLISYLLINRGIGMHLCAALVLSVREIVREKGHGEGKEKYKARGREENMKER